MLKIEKGIPIPKLRKPYGEMVLILTDMEVGDSVLLPQGRADIANLITSARRHTGFKYTQRATPDGQRVWRIE